MSVRVMADVWDFGPNDPVDNSVLLRLANHCNDDGRNCFPSLKDVAKAIRRSERTVARSVANLEKDGWIVIEQRGNGKGNTSQYIINVARLKGCQSVTQSKGDSLSAKGDSVTPKGDSLSAKGDSLSKPPHPLKGGTINEPSGNHQEPDRVEVHKVDSPPAVEPPQRKLAGTLPTNKGEDFPIYADQVEEWKVTYPAVDVKQELREMKAWANANPKERKTPGGMLRFLNAWLAREQDKGGSRGGHHGQPQSRAKQSVANDNRHTATSLVQDIRQRRDNHPPTLSLGDGVGAADADRSTLDAPGSAVGPDGRASDHSNGPGSAGGNQVLPFTGQATGTGWRRNLGPTF